MNGLLDGLPDASFGSDGQVVSTQFPNGSETNGIAMQADNKIVVAGNSGAASGASNFLIARYNFDGTPDSTFSTNGANTTSVAGVAYAVIVQPNGQIVAGGTTTPGMDNFVLARYNSDGVLDTTFQTTPATTIGGTIYDIALQSDGKIIAVGTDPSNSFAVIVRFNTNGSIDTTFEQISSNFGFLYGVAFESVAIADDGTIVAVDSAASSAVGSGMLIARYLPTGHLDTTFGSGGFTTISMTGIDFANAVTIQADNKIVVTGADLTSHLELARLNEQGLLDLSFGTNGTVFETAIDAIGQALVVQSDGKIVIAGLTPGLLGILLRYTGTGILDASFNSTGYVVTDSDASFLGVGINSTGKIIVTGTNLSTVQLNQYCVDSLHYSPLSQAIWKVYYNQLN